MSDTEGVVKYDFEYIKSAALDSLEINELNAWRKILFLLKLIGQNPERYDGFGYGNVSCRLKSNVNCHYKGKFIISGTQTGLICDLDNSHYALVTHCDPEQNIIKATGPIKPSSEALTHGVIYQANSDIQFVFHIHNPEIWNNALLLSIPQTRKNVLYGTPAMAKEIKRLMSDKIKNNHIISMQEHQDGIICYGKTAEETAATLMKYYSRALQL